MIVGNPYLLFFFCAFVNYNEMESAFSVVDVQVFR